MNKIWSIAIVLLAIAGAAVADEAEVQALEAKCEAAREIKLKPLRDEEIARCKADQRGDEGFCERYSKTFGDATRLPNGTMRPRMFDDLPECQAAFEARRKLNMK